MKQFISYLRQLDKRLILIYFFSYLIYLGLNKIFSNSMLYLIGEDSFRQRWTNFSVPCKDTPHIFIISFQIFKVVLFILLLKLSKTLKKEVLQEVLISYFIYDFVYILSFIWDLIPFPIRVYSWWTLISSGQIFLARYLHYLDLIFAGIWTFLLFYFLNKQHRLSLTFLATRLTIVTFSVPFFYFIFYLLLYRQ